MELHRPEEMDQSASENVFRIGNEVGEIARTIYDPDGIGELIDLNALGFDEAFERSATYLEEGVHVVCEAGLRAGGALAFADIMIPEGILDSLEWHMVEVKASTAVKDYHRDDLAIQAYIAAEAGVPLKSVGIAHVNSSFVYEGDRNYQGLLTEVDFTSEVKMRKEVVRDWIDRAHAVGRSTSEPCVATGSHCHDPFPCPFLAFCERDKPKVDFPLSSLPRLQVGKRETMEAMGISDLRFAPDELLSPTQKLVKDCSVSGGAYFDREAAAQVLEEFELPVCFLDFETVMFPVPIWKGTRPYQQIPFQFSLHSIDKSGVLRHDSFLDLSGNDPSGSLAKKLIETCGENGAVLAYNAGFEKRVIRELAERFPDMEERLIELHERLVDLLPIAKQNYYHPSQHGSWSLKAIIPAICPDISYSELEGIADGNAAADAFREAIEPGSSLETRQRIEKELTGYCHLDTLALVRMWEEFRGESLEAIAQV